MSAPVSGLSPATTYHFRIVARDGAGTATGADQTLTTTSQGPGPAPQPPQLAIRSVSIAGATATLRVAVQDRPAAMLGQSARQGPGAAAGSLDRLDRRDGDPPTEPADDEDRCRRELAYNLPAGGPRRSRSRQCDRQETLVRSTGCPPNSSSRPGPGTPDDHVRLSARGGGSIDYWTLDARTLRPVRHTRPRC